MSRKPLSSRNARWAPSLRAFFYGRPFGALPVRDCGLVALDGVAFWDLTAPMPAPQHLPHVRGVIAHPELPPYHRGNTLQGPEFVGEAIRPGPLQQQMPQLLALLLRQLARPTGSRLGSQRRLAAVRPPLLPLVH